MTEELLTEMNYDTMSALIDNYIERSSQQSGEMPTSSFFTLLFANLAQRIRNPFEIEGRIIDGKLVLLQPNIMIPDLYVENNQIVIGEQRVIVRLKA
jgi:hypothetical protein